MRGIANPLIPCLILACLSSVSVGLADEAPMVERAFAEYIRKSGMPGRGEVLVANMECSKRECMRFSLPQMPREELMKRLPQLLGGFGYGTEVVEFHFESSPTNFNMATLHLLTPPERHELKTEKLQVLVENFMVFLRHVSRLSEALPRAFAPAGTAKDARLFFLLNLSVVDSGSRMEALLLSPPEAPEPELQPGDVPWEPRCHTMEIETEGTFDAGQFAGWKRHRVVWRRVCNSPPKTIE
jgi:hypothetical protein